MTTDPGPRLSVRLSEGERAWIQREADRAGVTASEWVRARVLPNPHALDPPETSTHVGDGEHRPGRLSEWARWRVRVEPDLPALIRRAAVAAGAPSEAVWARGVLRRAAEAVLNC